MNLRQMSFIGLFLILAIQLQAAEEVLRDIMRPAEMPSIDYSDFPGLLNPDDLGLKFLATVEPDEDLYIKYGTDGYRRIQTGSGGLSRTHYYSGSSPIVFYRKGVDEEGEVIYQPVASCTFNANTKDLVICIQKHGEEYSVLPIDVSLEGQELGSARFVNFTPANLSVLLYDEKARVSPGGEMLTTFKSKEKTHFSFKVGAMYEGHAKMLYTKRHPYRGDTRILFIGYVVNSLVDGKTKFRVVSHYDRGPEAR
ncbi:hypothetical protein ACWPKO_12510 [Coraliomargarita sp. W4R53]